MKKINLALIAIFIFIGCSSNDEVIEELTPGTELQKDDMRLLSDYALYVTKNVYENSYDTKFGNIDYESAFKIMCNYDFGNRSVDISSYFKQTRSDADVFEMMKMNLTEAQYELVKDMMFMTSMTNEKLNEFRSKAALLDTSEQELIFFILDSSAAIIDGIMEGIGLPVSNLTRAQQNHTFGCNVASGAIGSVCGFLAGAICSVATPAVGIIVGGVVSTIVGAAISTAAC